MDLDDIREDLSFLSNREVILFGSYVTGEAGPNTDIDVAIIARLHDRKEMLRV